MESRKVDSNNVLTTYFKLNSFHINNVLTTYFKLNSFHIKIPDIRILLCFYLIGLFCQKPKLDYCFIKSPFIMDKYGISKRHYGHWKGMEIMEYAKKALISRSLKRHNSLNSDTMPFEISSRKYKRTILGV